MSSDLQRRKDEHLDLCLHQDVEASRTLLDGVAFAHCSAPELAVDQLVLETPFLGKKLRMPLLITGMTGGTPRARDINRIIAAACQAEGVAMGLGSQRAMLKDPTLLNTYQVRDVAPDILLLANIGGVQLRDMTMDAVRGLLASTGAGALCVHLNPAQEMLQPGGDRDFRGVLDAIRRTVDSLGSPVVVKETGAGLAPDIVETLAECGVAAVDISGSGGSSWTRVERLRSHGGNELFDGWGIPTAVCLSALNGCSIPVIASGGLRSGLDLARVLALGARVGGIALPALRAANSGGVEGVRELIRSFREQLQFVMLTTASAHPSALPQRMMLIDERIRQWSDELRAAKRPAAPISRGRDGAVTSRLSGFYKLGVPERRRALVEAAFVPLDEIESGARASSLRIEAADKMTENVIGCFALPFAVGLNLRVNGVDRLLPMAIEEPSIVAAVSRAARIVREGGGFHAEAPPSITVGQVHLTGVPHPQAMLKRVTDEGPRLVSLANEYCPRLIERGGGCRRVSARLARSTDGAGEYLIVHFHVDVVDAMGANMVNTIAEGMAPHLEELTRGRTLMCILTNLADERVARAWFEAPAFAFAFGGLGGEEVCRLIEEGWRAADADPYRAVTHNKGVMNGIDAVAIAMGQDFRALEAAAHAWAARSGVYRPLTCFVRTPAGLRGEISVPMPVTTVGPLFDTHPNVALAARLLGCEKAADLSCVMAAAGLAQNLAAVQALVTEGIQRGHMNLHQRRVRLARSGANAR
ncbi:MAG: Isopentenyl-diphosphate delta-isomerase [Myxococcota bacterium]|nr:Isopentenyl-diphosphate delta-isomerase [Myxococcota bacterium]